MQWSVAGLQGTPHRGTYTQLQLFNPILTDKNVKMLYLNIMYKQ